MAPANLSSSITTTTRSGRRIGLAIMPVEDVTEAAVSAWLTVC